MLSGLQKEVRRGRAEAARALKAELRGLEERRERAEVAAMTASLFR